jgi:hypothetical protein
MKNELYYRRMSTLFNSYYVRRLLHRGLTSSTRLCLHQTKRDIDALGGMFDGRVRFVKIQQAYVQCYGIRILRGLGRLFHISTRTVAAKTYRRRPHHEMYFEIVRCYTKLL